MPEEDHPAVPRLKELLRTGSVGLFLGAGASHCANLPMMAQLTDLVLDEVTQDESPLVHRVWLGLESNPDRNVENLLDGLYQLLAVSNSTANLTTVNSDEAEAAIRLVQEAIAKQFTANADITTHRQLVRQICRLSNRRRAVIATSNYDLLIEQACEAESIWCLDGFVGSNIRTWSPQALSLQLGTVDGQNRFHRHEQTIKLLKVHGSISWRADGDRITAHPDGDFDGSTGRRMVYPTPLKVTETFTEPYSALLREFTREVDLPNSLLITLGFSYRDDHIVEPLRQFLARSDHTLVALTRDPQGRLEEFLANSNVICMSEHQAWVDGGQIEAPSQLWQLPHFVSFLAEA